MAKKITIAELVIKIGTDTKEAVNGLKQVDKVLKASQKKTEQSAKQQAKAKQSQETKQARADEARIRHRERLQLNSQRAALQKEKLLLQDKLRSGQRLKRFEEAEHRRKLREQQQKERASRKSKNASSGTSIGSIAVGTALGAGITAAITSAIQAGFALFDIAKSTAMSKEQITTNTYGRYRARGQSPEEAKQNTQKDVSVISDLNKKYGYSFDTTGGAFQATTSSGVSREQATTLVDTILRELKSSGANEEAAFAFVREIKPLLAGGDISAQSSNQIENWGLLPVLASMMGITERELSKIAKEGKLATETGKLDIKKLQQNLNTKGVGKFIKEDPSMNPVTRASQELDAAISRLKDTFSVHASSGIAASLNSLADALGNPATQATIIKAGQRFGELLVAGSEAINTFVTTGGVEKLSAIFSSENMNALQKHVTTTITLLGKLNEVLGRLFGDSESAPANPHKLDVGTIMDRFWTSANDEDRAMFEDYQSRKQMEALKARIDASTPPDKVSLVQQQQAVSQSNTSNANSQSSVSSVDQSKHITVHGDVTTGFVSDMESRGYSLFVGKQ